MNGDIESGIAVLRCARPDGPVSATTHPPTHPTRRTLRPDARDSDAAARRSRGILASVGDCSDVSLRYVALRRALCGGGGGAGAAGVSGGLEGAWGLLLASSLLWIALLPCMCQAGKHAEQVRHGRRELRPDGDGPLAAAAAAAAGPADAREVLRVRLTLGGPLGGLPSFRHDRLLLEVRDALSTGLEIAPGFIAVACDPARKEGPGLQARRRPPHPNRPPRNRFIPLYPPS